MTLRKMLPLFGFLLLFSVVLNAQQEEEGPVFEDHDIEEEEEFVEVQEEVFVIVEQMPRFPGCEEIEGRKAKENCAEKQFSNYLYEQIEYPAIAKENRVVGNCTLQFIVNPDGTIRDSKIIRDIGAGCGKAAKKVIDAMNENGIIWIPGQQRSRKVAVRVTQQVEFRLPKIMEKTKNRSKKKKRKGSKKD